MRIDTKKFLFLGPESERETFFKKAQELGVIHFVDERTLKSDETSEDLRLIQQAIRAVKALAPTEQEETDDYFKAEAIARTITSLRNEHEVLEEKVRTLKLEIARVHVFGNFLKEEVASLEKETGRLFQFFCAKLGLFHGKEIPKPTIYVGSDHGLDYFVTFEKKPFQQEGMVEMEIPHSLGELKKELFAAETRLREIEKVQKPLARFDRFLHESLTVVLNEHNLKTAMSYPKEILDGSIFTVSAWVPEDKVHSVAAMTQALDVHFEEIAPNEGEVAPTYLENTGMHRLGEELVHIYDTPSNTDKDPSLWVLFFFSLFFAFIVGDGGYGLVYLLSALYILYRAKRVTKGGMRFFRITAVVFSSCIIWGLFTSSFFGIQFPKDSFIKKISVIQWLADKKAAYHMQMKDEVYQDWVKKLPHVAQAKTPEEFLDNGDILNKFSDNIMFELALFLGVVHICLSLARYATRNWPAFGWIIAIIGAYLYFPIYLDATSLMTFAFGVSKSVAARQGLYMMCGGISLAMILAFIQHKFWGILELMNVIQIFADIMSYLRLYALGLAGAIVTSVINDFSFVLGPFFGAILIILGHGVNLVLGIMGGVIHGLRLNFLEWYHYSFEGGGKRFIPLERHEIE